MKKKYKNKLIRDVSGAFLQEVYKFYKEGYRHLKIIDEFCKIITDGKGPIFQQSRDLLNRCIAHFEEFLSDPVATMKSDLKSPDKFRYVIQLPKTLDNLTDGKYINYGLIEVSPPCEPLDVASIMEADGQHKCKHCVQYLFSIPTEIIKDIQSRKSTDSKLMN